MNRRHFIKSAAIASVAIPSIAMAIKPSPPKLERVHLRGDYIDIMDVEELQEHGIRAQIYSASCIDSKGTFAGERGYCDKHMEPFCRQSHIVKSLPQYWIGKYWGHSTFTQEQVESVIRDMRRGHFSLRKGDEMWTLTRAIEEIKQNMEYVCLFGYTLFPEVKEEAWPAKWMPVVGGLSKYRYNQMVASMNDPRDPLTCDCATCRCAKLI